MRLLIAIMFVAALMAEAYAQMTTTPGETNPQDQAEQEKRAKRRAEDKKYKSPLSELPDKKFDPWGDIRQTPKSK